MEIVKKNPKIFIISGKARAGKDTCGNYMKEVFDREDFKTIIVQFSSTIKDYAKKIVLWDGQDETKPREFLQMLGMEVIRNNIDEDFFIKRMIQDINVYSYFYDVIIITDSRFRKEIEDVKSNFKDAIFINIVRPNGVSDLSNSELKHATEVDLDNYDNYDIKIINDGTLEDLERKVMEIFS